MNQKGFSPIIIVLVVIAALAGGVFVWQYFGAPEEEAPDEAVKDETANWETYRNDEYGFEVKYPEDWNFSEENENPEYALGTVSFYSNEAPQEVPMRIFIYTRGELRLGTRAWESFKIGEKNLSVECVTAKICDIVGLFTDMHNYLVQTYTDPRQDVTINQMLSTFRFLPPK